MTTVAAGTSKTFTANARGQRFMITKNADSIVNISGAVTERMGQRPHRRAIGPFEVGDQVTVAADLGDVIIEGLYDAGASVPGVGVVQRKVPLPIVGARSFTPSDDGQPFGCTVVGPYTLTFPSTLSWVEGVSIDLPATGAITFQGDGTTPINGTTAAVTRTLAAGQRTIAVTPGAVVGSLNVSGT